MNINFLQGERVWLRAVEPEDLELMYEMENDPSMWDISNFNVPYSKYVLRQYIQASQYDLFADKQLRLMIVLKEGAQVCGTLDITDFSAMHMRGEVGIALMSRFRGQGLASEALALLCQYAFRFLGMVQLYAHIAADNDASLRLFEACGFVQRARLQKWLKIEGEYKDAVLLQLLNTAKKG